MKIIDLVKDKELIDIYLYVDIIYNKIHKDVFVGICRWDGTFRSLDGDSWEEDMEVIDWEFSKDGERDCLVAKLKTWR